MDIKIKTCTGYMITPVKDIRVFFNKDCMKYGVEAYGNLWSDGIGDRWQQIALDTKHPYTPYKKVAERWLNKLLTTEE